MITSRYLLLGLGCLLFTSISEAADVNAGKAKAAACQGCHGAEGISTSAIWPILAGQSAAYLETQLKAFKSGARKNPSMNPLAEPLTPTDIQNLAAYFASLPGKSAGGDSKLAEQGKGKAAMCMGCHGDKLQGNGQFPKLAGQHPQYLETQLKNYKANSRSGGPMNAMTQGLSEEDIKALAAYAGSLGK